MLRAGADHVQRLARFERVAGANHFLNDGPVEPLLAALEACIPVRKPLRLRLPKLPVLAWPGFPPIWRMNGSFWPICSAC